MRLLRYLLFLCLLSRNGLSLYAQVSPDSMPTDTAAAPSRTRSAGGLPTGPMIVLGDSAGVEDLGDTNKRQKKVKEAKPPRDTTFNEAYAALRRSLILPGWGQIYNRSLWKAPIVWAGFGVIGYFVYDNNRLYQEYREIYKCKNDTACAGRYPTISPQAARFERDRFRRYRDMNIIFGVLWYTMNGLDAYVEGHLKTFDVSDDLSMRIKPVVYPVQMPQGPGLAFGAGFTLTLKR